MNLPSRLSFLTGFTSLLLGTVVLLGWHIRQAALIQVNPAFAPMQYNTALGFALAGLALLFLIGRRFRAAATLALVVLLLGVLTLAQYLFGFDLSIDQLLMTHYIDVEVSHPGRMAPNTALCFSLTGLAVIVAVISHRKGTAPGGFAVIGALIIGLGIVALAGYFIGVKSAYGWGHMTRMAIHTAAGFVTLGAGMIALAWSWDQQRNSQQRFPGWVPIVIGITGTTVSFASWQAMLVHEQGMVAMMGAEGKSYADESLLIFGLLFTLALAVSARTTGKADSEKRKVERVYAPYVVIVLGLLLSLSLYGLLETNFQASVKARFDSEARNHAEAIEQGFETYLETLYHVRSSFDASSFAGRDEFRVLTRRDLQRLPGLTALEWVPLVLDRDRDTMESAARQEVSADFVFGDNPTRDGMTPAPRRERYFPIYYVEPLQANSAILGFDLAGSPERFDTLLKTIETNMPALSSRFELLQSERGNYSVFAALPVYNNDMALDTAVERKSSLRGFVLMVVDVGPMIEMILDRYTSPAGLTLEFEDTEAAADKRFIYRHISRIAQPEADKIDNTGNELAISIPIKFADRNWIMSAVVANHDVYPSWNAGNVWLPLGVFLLSLVMAAYIRKSTQREQERSRLLAFQVALLDSIPNPIFVKNTDAVYTACNKAYEKAFGADRLEFIGKTVVELDHLREGELETFQQGDLQLIRTGGYTQDEMSIRFADGADHDVLFWRTTFELADGEPGGMIGGLIDITERKKAESELAHSRMLMHEVLEHSPAMVYLKDLEGRYLMVNHIWTEVTGVAESRAIGATDFDLLPQQIAEVFVEHDRLVAEAGNPLQVEEQLPQADGIIHTYMSYKFPVTDAGGKLFALGGVSSDITEIKLSERQYRVLVDTIPGTVYRCRLDENWTQLFISKEVEVLTGYPPSDFMGNAVRSFISVIHRDDTDRIYQEVMQAIAERRSYVVEYRVIRADGGVRYVYERGQAEYGEDGKAEILDGTIIDITELKALQSDLEQAKEAADAANQAKSAFLANMSHELRTPMNAILGYSEMLMEEAEDLEQEDFIPDLKKINQAGSHLLALINDVLDLSKIEAGRMEAYAEDIDVSVLIDEVSATAQPLMAKNKNRLVIERGGHLGKAYQDLTKLRQSLFNLLSNAAKFTHEGTITLTATRDAMNDEDWLSFAVSDTGIGIPAAKIDHIFEEFSQADDSTTRNYGGTGLGLAITRRFCRMLGGDITLRSRLDEGSTFTIRVPAIIPGGEVKEAPTQPVSAKSDEELAAIQRAGAEGTVLVIDDDPEASEIIERYLTKDGFNVVTAGNGEQGLRLAHEIQPAAITLDVLMPEMDGWSVLRALKADPVLQDIPVVMLTMLDDKSKGFSLGATDYLTKPVDREQLHNALARYYTPGESCSVLLVEDDEATREIMARTLEQSNWTVSEAGNGREALDGLAKHKPRLILLDLMMPVMDGFDFLLEMRANPEWQDIPVIVLTAKDLTEEDRRLLSGRVEQIVEKGACDHEQLAKLVRQVAGLHTPSTGRAAAPAQ